MFLFRPTHDAFRYHGVVVAPANGFLRKNRDGLCELLEDRIEAPLRRLVDKLALKQSRPDSFSPAIDIGVIAQQLRLCLVVRQGRIDFAGRLSELRVALNFQESSQLFGFFLGLSHEVLITQNQTAIRSGLAFRDEVVLQPKQERLAARETIAPAKGVTDFQRMAPNQDNTQINSTLAGKPLPDRQQPAGSRILDYNAGSVTELCLQDAGQL